MLVCWAGKKEMLYALSVRAAFRASWGLHFSYPIEVVVERRVTGAHLEQEASIALREVCNCLGEHRARY